jgi:hypothetical protein
MIHEVLPFDRGDIRAADANSLLRFHDLAAAILKKSVCQLERIAADRALQRIAKELKKRQVALGTAIALTTSRGSNSQILSYSEQKEGGRWHDPS